MTPSMTQVLASGAATHGLNFGNFAALLAVVCVTVFSAAKGLELYRKNRFIPELDVAEQENGLADQHHLDKLEKLTFIADELNREKEMLLKKNVDLKSEVRHLEEKKQLEEALRKSNIALAKECERLKAEKEDLVNAKIVKPAVKISKKGAKRKPQRVSAKKK